MKGWIKVHTFDDGIEHYIRASDITIVLRKRVCTAITLKHKEHDLYVEETDEEVMRFIEEAEGKKSLYEELENIKTECSVNYSGGYCTGCTRIEFCDALSSDPLYWDMKKIEEGLK